MVERNFQAVMKFCARKTLQAFIVYFKNSWFSVTKHKVFVCGVCTLRWWRYLVETALKD